MAVRCVPGRVQHHGTGAGTSWRDRDVVSGASVNDRTGLELGIWKCPGHVSDSVGHDPNVVRGSLAGELLAGWAQVADLVGIGEVGRGDGQRAGGMATADLDDRYLVAELWAPDRVGAPSGDHEV